MKWVWLPVAGLGLWGVAAPAGAATPSADAAPSWRLRAVSSVVEDTLSARARAAGAAGDAAIPACSRVAPGLLLCVQSEQAPTEVAMRAELTAAGTTVEAVVAGVRAGVEAAWVARPAGTYTVEGVAGRYFVRAEGDGFDAAALLRPELLARLAGAPPVVAVPEDGTLLWWVPGDADFDKMVAVGARRMAEASSAAVSPRVYRHDGERWAVWAEVRGSVEVSGATEAPPFGASP